MGFLSPGAIGANDGELRLGIGDVLEDPDGVVDCIRSQGSGVSS